MSPADVAKVLANAYGRRVTEQQVREVAEAGGLVRADGTLSLIEYAAHLAGHQILRNHRPLGQRPGCIRR